MPTKRLAIHAYVSDEAHTGWHDFAEENGMSVSALFEALGLRLATATAAGTEPAGFTEDLFAQARGIDAVRRKRKGHPKR